MKKLLIGLVMTLMIWIYFSNLSCSSFSSTTTIVVDSADVHGIKYDKQSKIEAKK